MLKIENLNFSYKKKQVLKDINLHIKKGNIVSILGPNGSGKTTLIKNILGIEKHNSGNIYIDGEKIEKISIDEKAKKIAYVPQLLSENFSINVMELIVSGLKPHIDWKVKEENLEVVVKLMDKFLIRDLADKEFSSLSGGQKQKVLICKAIAQDTEIIVLDEPTSFLDLKNALEILEIVKGISKTIIMVLHDLNFAKSYSEKIVLMKNGEIVEWGDTEEVLTKENIKKTYGVNVKLIEGYIIPII